jgi:hypothetical protein
LGFLNYQALRNLLATLIIAALLPFAARAQCADGCVDVCGPIFLEVVESMEEGGLVVKLAAVGNRTLPLIGARGGWFLDDNVVAGFSGYATRLAPSNVFQERTFGYMGIFLDVRHMIENPIHLSTSAFLGFGGSDGFELEGRSSFWLFEPEVAVLFQVADNFKIGLGGSYRFYFGSTSIRQAGITPTSVNISLLFGS